MAFDTINVLFKDGLFRLVIAIVILVIGLLLGRFLGRLVKRVLKDLGINKILKEEVRVNVKAEEFLGRAISYLIYFAALILALSQIGLATTVLYIILITILILLIAFIILAFKDFIPNIIAGLFIHQGRDIRKGDYIKIGDVEGEIININLVETKIKAKGGDIIFIPNSILTKREVTKIKKRK